MFLPEKWPAYFSKAAGCKVWDLDGTEYLDMSIMGIGTNILGYGHPEVDKAVCSAVREGNMSTFNCPDEVYLAEKLVEINPWSDMVRFARSGGEAVAIAIRIARAVTNKSKIAFCGYHGWTDWYLAANLSGNENLAGHLLPGLEPNGVPGELLGTALPFKYNDFNELSEIVAAADIGVVIMEVTRNTPPDDGFLMAVRQLTADKGIVLIFDESTSGFRQSFGGIHQLFDVTPDIAVYGKALGNGYACTAVVGCKEVMQAGQASFISSTFWTEKIGSRASLKTLEIMEKTKSWEIITEVGKMIQERWRAIAAELDIPMNISGIPSLPSFSFKSENNLAYKTYITQELLKDHILAGDLVCVCVCHDDIVLAKYFTALESVLRKIKECEDGRNIFDLLEGPIRHAKFSRLN